MKPIRTIRPDIDEDFLVPLIISESERWLTIIGIMATLGIILGAIIFITFLLLNAS